MHAALNEQIEISLIVPGSQPKKYAIPAHMPILTYVRLKIDARYANSPVKFRGNNIDNDTTATTLGLEDGDSLEVVQT